jgi:hypothetical protein
MAGEGKSRFMARDCGGLKERGPGGEKSENAEEDGFERWTFSFRSEFSHPRKCFEEIQ